MQTATGHVDSGDGLQRMKISYLQVPSERDSEAHWSWLALAGAACWSVSAVAELAWPKAAQKTTAETSENCNICKLVTEEKHLNKAKERMLVLVTPGCQGVVIPSHAGANPPAQVSQPVILSWLHP